MGQAKKHLIDLESKRSILDSFIILLSDNKFEGIIDNEILNDLYFINDWINSTKRIPSSDFALDLFSDKLFEIYSALSRIVDKYEPYKKNLLENNIEIILLINNLRSELSHIKAKLRNNLRQDQNIYNSEEYYNNQIEELKRQKEELKSSLIRQENMQGKSKEELALHKKEIKEKEIALLIANEQIKNYQKELEEKKKQENAVIEWNNKIKSTFSDLTEYLSPIKDEHRRLNVMFWIYSTLIVISLGFIVILEIKLFLKLNSVPGFPDWRNYFSALAPIPVLGALLWAFIIQLNRTQRQLVVLAKHIHEIRYIEGLLLSLNSLSPDITDSTKRVNIAIERLIENHLNISASYEKISEENIINEEKKDVVPYELVVKILKELKDYTNK